MRRPAKSHYPRLGAHERFQLWQEARARGDDAECEYLVETCPEYVYKATELAFSLRLIVNELVAASFSTVLLSALLALANWEFEREYLVRIEGVTSTVFADERSEGHLSDLPEHYTTWRRTVDDTCSELTADVLGARDGFKRFCVDIGTEPVKLLKGHRRGLLAWRRVEALPNGDVAPDSAIEDAMYEGLKGIWTAFLWDDDAAA